jgi:hypothetical protein
MNNRIAITVFLIAGLGRAMVHGAEPDRAAPIPPPPQDRSLLPAPREVKSFGCGLFMTEGGIDEAETEAARAEGLAGVQRMVEICEQNGYGWCLRPYGDWADGFSTYGAQVETRTVYPLITGKRH